MKTMNQLAALAALVALAGCNPGSSPPGDKTPETPSPTGAVIELPKDTPAVTLNKQPTAVPAPVPPTATPAAPAAAEKADFIASTEQKLKEFDAKIDELAKKSAGYKDDAKAQADQTLAALRDQRAKLNGQFDSLKQSSAAAWKEIKAGFEAAFNELEKAYENVKSKFS